MEVSRLGPRTPSPRSKSRVPYGLYTLVYTDKLMVIVQMFRL